MYYNDFVYMFKEINVYIYIYIYEQEIHKSTREIIR